LTGLGYICVKRMIPTYKLSKESNKDIIIDVLGVLNKYDFTEPHRHDYFEFFYFKKGGGTHSIDFIEFPIKSNSIHIVAPGQVHQVNRALDSEGLVALFELGDLNAAAAIENFLFEHCCLDAEELNPTFKLDDAGQTGYFARAENILRYFGSGEELDKLLLANEIQALCLECMKLKKEQAGTGNSRYFEFRKLLKQHYKELKKVKDYSELLKITEKALNDLVKKQTGQTASHIIYGQVIMEARRLLKVGTSIKETAFALNFDDPAHFSKFFKSQTGQSPSEFVKIR